MKKKSLPGLKDKWQKDKAQTQKRDHHLLKTPKHRLRLVRCR